MWQKVIARHFSAGQNRSEIIMARPLRIECAGGFPPYGAWEPGKVDGALHAGIPGCEPTAMKALREIGAVGATAPGSGGGE